MHQIGETKHYSGAEAAALSGLDAGTIDFCVAARAVSPIMQGDGLRFSEQDVLILKLIATLIVCKRSLRAAERLRAHFGLAGQSAERVEASAIAKLVDRLMQRE
ncbi:MAG: hypothetical protein JNM45_03365 [Rhizobiales bacterium]|nr:hypothetical protein [Hyphomicrobiales bacterium]